jgi:hypothetical protein
VDRLELLEKIEQELKLYKEYLLNIMVVSNINTKNELEDQEEKDETKKNETAIKKIKTRNKKGNI